MSRRALGMNVLSTGLSSYRKTGLFVIRNPSSHLSRKTQNNFGVGHIRASLQPIFQFKFTKENNFP